MLTLLRSLFSRGRCHLLVSFLPAWAVGVVCDAAFLRAFVNGVAMTFVLGLHKRIIGIVQAIVCAYLAMFISAPRQRQGKQGEEGYFYFSFHISCFCGGL